MAKSNTTLMAEMRDISNTGKVIIKSFKEFTKEKYDSWRCEILLHDWGSNYIRMAFWNDDFYTREDAIVLLISEKNNVTCDEWGEHEEYEQGFKSDLKEWIDSPINMDKCFAEHDAEQIDFDRSVGKKVITVGIVKHLRYLKKKKQAFNLMIHAAKEDEEERHLQLVMEFNWLQNNFKVGVWRLGLCEDSKKLQIRVIGCWPLMGAEYRFSIVNNKAIPLRQCMHQEGCKKLQLELNEWFDTGEIRLFEDHNVPVMKSRCGQDIMHGVGVDKAMG